MLTLNEAKSYLRVDSDFEDGLIASLILSAETLCMDVARLTKDEWDAISTFTPDNPEIPNIRGKGKKEILQMSELLRVGALYTLGYLYEHREEADHHDLTLTLRNLLFSIREGVL